MTPPSNRPDLRRIGESAFAEVLGTLLSLSVTVANSAGHNLPAAALDPITSRVLLTGQRLSASVHVQLPQAFVIYAVHLLAGVANAAADTNGLLDDAAGELANMIAGRVAAQLAAGGYPCALGTPSVSRSVPLPIKTQPGVEHGRADLLCEGHRLSLQIQCCYVVP